MAEIINWPINQFSKCQMSLSNVEKYSQFIVLSGSEKQVFLTCAGEKMENQYSLSNVEKYSQFIVLSGSEKQVFLTCAGEKMENHYFRQRVGNSHACHTQ